MTIADPRRDGESLVTTAVRERAEDLARFDAASLDGAVEASLPEVARAALHELRVHQIELELQNEELRAAQAALAASREAYVDLYELAPVGYCTIDGHGIVAQANLTAATLIGVARGALVGQPLTRFVAPADQDTLYHLRRRLTLTGAPHSCELRLQAGDGAATWVELKATPVTSQSAGDLGAAQPPWAQAAGGEDRSSAAPTGAPEVRLALVDIGPRKRAEAAAQVEQRNLRAVLDAAPTAILVVNAVGGVVHANPATERLFGPVAPGHPRRWGDVVHCVAAGTGAAGCGHEPGCDVCPLALGIHEGLAGRAASGREMALTTAFGGRLDTRQIVLGAEPLRLDGEPAVVVALQDITALRREQHEREALQARLSQSDRLASVGLLSAGVAHEINNPLSFILSNVELALDALIDDGTSLSELRHMEVVTALEEALDGAERVRLIVRGLMAHARSDDDRKGAVDVERALESTLRMVGHEVRQRARLVCDFGRVPPVDGNELHLGQVFLNLVMNAVQAMPEGDVDHHELRVSTRLAADGRVCVEVRDTGAGIPEALLGRVFDPFFTTKPVGVGTGLGLSICHGLVARDGGEITVESAVGRGTSFKVFLHVAAPRPVVQAPRTQQAPRTTPPPVAMRRGHLLLIDDEPAVGKALARLLQRQHDVELLASPRAALARLRAGDRFDVIFCDLMMPELSGMELHQELCGFAPDQADRMVFVTGGAFGAAAQAFLERVRNRCVFKPFEPALLQQTLAELLAAAPPAAAP